MLSQITLQIAIEIFVLAQGEQKQLIFIIFINQKKQSVVNLEFVNENAGQVSFFRYANLGSSDILTAFGIMDPLIYC